MAEQNKSIRSVLSSPPSSKSAPTRIMNENVREESIEDSITVASSALASRMATTSPINPSFSNITAFPELASPISSNSSLSDPPSEHNSPVLFPLDGPHIKPEPIDDNPGYAGLNTLVTNDSVLSRTKGAYYRPRVRGVDVCADPDTVEAYRVAKAIADTEGDDLVITGLRSLRSSNRLSSIQTVSSLTKPSTSNNSPNQMPRISKKRGRSSISNKPKSELPRSEIIAIKQEFENVQAGIRDTILTNPPFEQKKRLLKRPGKKRKLFLTPKTIPMPSQRIPSQLQISNPRGMRGNPIADRTVPPDPRNKGPEAWREREQGHPKRCASLPPSLPSYRCVSPFDLDKRSLHQSRASSEGAEEPRDLTPVVPQVYRKNGVLTDVVTIMVDRLRPRKSFGQKHNPTSSKKRTLDKETEESSDDGFTQDESLSDASSDISEKTDDGNDDEEEEEDDSDAEDGEPNGFGVDDKLPTSTIKKKNSQTTRTAVSSKKRKLNSGKGSYKKKNKKPVPITDINDLDERIWPEAAILVSGIYMIPNGCRNCLESHYFCNRKMPCGRCTRRGTKCFRAEGLLPARPKQNRIPKGQIQGPSISEFIAPEFLEFSPSPPPQKKRRGRLPKPLFTISPSLDGNPSPSTVVTPRTKKVWIKKEATIKIKKEKEIKEVPMINLIDPQEGKPPGIRRPEVWCESRQELCESLPYYRSYQSGCYGHDGLVHGYLLDGFPAPRDYIDGKVVISHSGGKSVADDDGQRRLLTNQTSEDKVIKYLLANMKNQLPLVMIMGQHCCNSPSKLPHRYCVMDWFKVTAGWAERDPRSRFTRWKFRFEKLDSSADGWWASKLSIESNPQEEMVKASCNTCKTESPHVYEIGWMCLNPECTKFWTIDGNDAPADIKYTHNFLHCRTTWPSEFLTAPNNLGPSLNLNRDVFFDGGDVSRIFWKGMCCPKCGRLNCREVWAGWRCLSCDFKLNPPRTIFDAARLADPHRPVFTGPAIPANICHDDITYERFVKDGMTVIQYQLGDCGTVTHILSNQSSNARPKDADWLFREYQSNDMPFKRFPLGNHKSAGRLLTQQFTFNCGKPYKFIVDVESHPFKESPPVVCRALEVIHGRVSLVHPEAEFNEILNVGYFEKQKMDYHDDGEAGLGETVASISLGAPARMRFRVKARYTSERHCWTTKPPTPLPLPHSRPNGLNIKSEPKNDDLDVNDDEDEDLEHNEDVIGVQPLPTPLVRGPKRSGKGRVKLDLCLSHGDVMVMKGRNIQKYWEHSVIPQGLFRIAATARFITENHPGVLNQVKSEITTKTEKPTTKQEIIVPDLPIDTIPEANPTASNNPVHLANIDTGGSAVYPTLNPLVPDPWPGQPSSNTEHGVTPMGVDSEPHSSINTVPNTNVFPTLVLPSQNTSMEAEPIQRLPNFPRADILHSMDQPIVLNKSMSSTSFSSHVVPISSQTTPQSQLPKPYDITHPQVLQPFYPSENFADNIHRSSLDQGHVYFADDGTRMDSQDKQPCSPHQARAIGDSTSCFTDGSPRINSRNNPPDSCSAIPIQTESTGIITNCPTDFGAKIDIQSPCLGLFGSDKTVEVGDWTTKNTTQILAPNRDTDPWPSS